MTSKTIVEKSRSNAGSLCGNGLTEQPPDLVETFGNGDVPTPRSATFAADEAGFGEHTQVMADRALTQAETGDEVADAGFAARRFLQEAEQFEARRAGQRLEHLGDATRVSQFHALTE
ncbi:hypothetical protein GCM10011609_28280 [Lentzea pudingi]|uniref:Uncharacterized protein n=1 Tax=Lentzea pudingi TaxID=1789439 RepID=A0ABQ2HTS8_9PSEU|nr:hypothetical protein GCM10011609_28280 [Lentzea pudingi]